MQTEESLVEISINPDRTDEFVDRLANDEAFRRALEDRPAETLAEYDISVSPDLLAAPVSLPPREEIERARAAMDSGEFAAENIVQRFIHWVCTKIHVFSG